MPANQEHISQAKHNIGFLESFYNTYKFNDWAVTVSFYASIHIIEAAIFAQDKIKFKTKEITIKHSNELAKHLNSSANVNYHKLRILIINENFPEILDWFKMLYNESQTARYVEYGFENEKVDLLVKTCLKRIVDWANKKYSSGFNLKLE